MIARHVKKSVALAVLSILIAVGVTSAMAQDGEWKKNHPHRAEVNKRLNNQDRRIHQEVKEGEMSKSEAAKLHKKDHQIRQEERDKRNKKP